MKLKNIGYASRKKFFFCRLVFIASLFWILIDVFEIFTLTSFKSDSVSKHEHIEVLKSAKNAPIKTKTNENPTDWPGEQGKPVVLPKHLEKLAEERFKENYFNVVVSDMIALNRSVGEQRNKKCLQKVYGDDLPNTSIIIIYHNEANSTLLRGLTSLVRKTPSKYLKEIILVDDASLGREYLHEPLDKFVKALPVKVQIFRNEVRQGLIRSRLIGAAAATGDTLTFLDAHIEATDGWIEPLLYEIKMNRQASF